MANLGALAFSENVLKTEITMFISCLFVFLYPTISKTKLKPVLPCAFLQDLVFVRIFHLICAAQDVCKKTLEKTYISNTPTHEEIKLANY